MAEEVAIIDGRAWTRTEYNNYVSHLGNRRHLAPAFNPIQAPVAAPPPTPATPPAPVYQAPTMSAPQQAPTVASVSTVNEVREKAKASKGFQSTLLTQGLGGNKRSRARSSKQESKISSQKQLTAGVTKRTLLGAGY